MTPSSAACRKGLSEISLECLRVLSRDRLAAMLWQLLILLGLRLPSPVIADQAEQLRIVFDGKTFTPSIALLAELTSQAYHQTLLDKQPANGDATSPKVEGAAVHRLDECELCKDMEVGVGCCLAVCVLFSTCARTQQRWSKQGTHDLPGFERGRSACNSTGLVLHVALYAVYCSTTWLQQCALAAVCPAALHPVGHLGWCGHRQSSSSEQCIPLASSLPMFW